MFQPIADRNERPKLYTIIRRLSETRRHDVTG